MCHLDAAGSAAAGPGGRHAGTGRFICRQPASGIHRSGGRAAAHRRHTAWAAKRLGVSGGSSSGLLHMVSSTSVGARERVVVVEIGESWLVVGVTPGSINTLMTLPKGELPSPRTTSLNTNFAARLQHMIEKRRDK